MDKKLSVNMGGEGLCEKQRGAGDIELLYMAAEKDGVYYIGGFTERNTAESLGICHLSVIIAPFVAGGPSKGKWIVHDRLPKQQAKGRAKNESPSYNFFGGHCTADITRTELIGKEIPPEICLEAARRELAEELLCRGSSLKLEIWDKGEKTDRYENAGPYKAKELIPLGFSSFTSGSSSEFSYFYALPVPEKDIDKLLAADDYRREGKVYNVSLPIHIFSEEELRHMWQERSGPEVCDAISRLWLFENSGVAGRLRNIYALG